MLSINNIPFKGYVRYGLNPNKNYLESKAKCANAISRCNSSIQKEVADTMNEVTRSLKCIPTNDEFMVDAEYKNSTLFLTAARFNGERPAEECEVQLHNTGKNFFNQSTNVEFWRQFREEVEDKFVKEGKEFIPDDTDSIMDYLV